jgi:hypothetical protein
MSEHTEITCRSHEAANATHAYLLSQLNEDENAPSLTARVEGASLHVAYERDGEPQRDAWDKQLIGFRDGFELCQPFYKIPFDDSVRRAQADKNAVNFVNNALGI